MKKILVVFLSTFVFLFLATATYALSNRDVAKIVTLPAGQTINHDYFATGNSVTISGVVNGDVYAAGGQILVDGVINGDLIASGGMINVTGKVSGNIRAAGGQIIISGDIGKNLTVFGGSINLNSSATIRGGVVAAGGSILIETPVAKNVNVAGGNVTLSSLVSGNLAAATSRLILTSKAAVNGDLNYTSQNDASIDSSAIISGKVTKTAIREDSNGSPLSRKIAFIIFGFLSTLVVGFLFLRFLPKFSLVTVHKIGEAFWASLGLGFAILFLAPIGIIILMVTLIGIPLALLILATYMVGLYLSSVVFMYWAGTWISKLTRLELNKYLVLVLGALIYWAIGLIPLLGGLTSFIGVMLGLGALSLTLKHKTPPT